MLPYGCIRQSVKDRLLSVVEVLGTYFWRVRSSTVNDNVGITTCLAAVTV